MIIKVPWQAWYGDVQKELTFPDDWSVELVTMSDAKAIGTETVDRALINPLGTPPLKELAEKSEKAVIVVEDITRPVPTASLLTNILTQLESGGLESSDMWIIIGLGAHVPMGRQALIKKLGKVVVENYSVYQHQPYENLEYLGKTQRGTPVHINRFYLEADLHIGLGSIIPHPYAGFGGGAKIVAVGVAGMDTIGANHYRALAGEAGGVDCVEGNECRADMEEIARMAGLSFIVNGVVNSRRELTGVFAGDPVQAHRAGVEWARRVYATELPPQVDMVFLNAYPKDTDLMQSINALNAVGFDLGRVLKADGSAVIIAGCPEGLGIHYLSGVGMRGQAAYDRDKDFGGHSVIIYSPNLSYPEVKQRYPPDTLVFNHWREVIEELQRRHGRHASAAVFPCATLQIPSIG